MAESYDARSQRPDLRRRSWSGRWRLTICPGLPVASRAGPSGRYSPSRCLRAECVRCPLAASDTASLIALAHGRAIGLLSLHFRERLSQPARSVDSRFRCYRRGARAGAAKRTVGTARSNWRPQRGCHRLVLESHYHRKRALPVLRARGFRRRWQVLLAGFAAANGLTRGIMTQRKSYGLAASIVVSPDFGHGEIGDQPPGTCWRESAGK